VLPPLVSMIPKNAAYMTAQHQAANELKRTVGLSSISFSLSPLSFYSFSFLFSPLSSFSSSFLTQKCLCTRYLHLFLFS